MERKIETFFRKWQKDIIWGEIFVNLQTIN